MTKTTRFLFLLTWLPILFAVRTDKWDHCNCYWGTWKSWSDCTKQCNGGRQQRERWVWWTRGRGCTEFEDCASSGPDNWQYRDCNEICYNGGTFTGYYSCNCPPRWKGTCCDEEVTCGSPGSITNGRVIGSSYNYGSVVRYTCHTHYRLTRGNTEQRCTRYGYWSGTKPLCLFANTCQSNPCQNGGTCVNDIQRYDCRCLQGWSGVHCEIDVQPPLQRGCPRDKTYTISTPTVVVNWTEPTFYDPMNTRLQISRNYPINRWEFEWGDFPVQYVATKVLNGLRSQCVFTIKVRPHQCEQLRLPGRHISIVCTTMRTDFGQYCRLFCDQTRTMNNYDQWFVCGASGHWIPSSNLPQCDMPFDNAMISNRNAEFHYRNCSDSQSIDSMKDVFLARLRTSPFSTFCRRFHDNCDKENVSVLCN